MDLEKCSKAIEENAKLFFEDNFERILTEFKMNIKEIKGNLTNYVFNDLDNDKDFWGLYVFYIEPKETIQTYEELYSLWTNNNKKLKSPNVIKKRFKVLNQNEQYCFYIGKSQDLKKRISQHINQTTKESTYSLKLSKHNNFIKNNIVKFSYCILDKNPSLNKDGKNYLLTYLEKKLRDEFQPLAGKQ